MKKILDVIYGILLGIANVIPGASGGTIAVLTGIFDRLVDNIANVLKNPFKSVKNLLFIIIGVLVGLVISIVAVEKLIEYVPIPTFFFFSGLIIGGIPFIFKKVQKEKKSPISWIIFALSFIAIIAMTFLSEGQNKEFTFSFGSMIILFGLGVIALMAMILPGVSGSMVVASMGYYESLLNLLSGLLSDLIKFNFTTDIILVLCFCLGALIGLIAFAKIIKYLLKNFFTNTFMSILGLVCASCVAVIIISIKDYGTDYLLIGCITLVVGIVAGFMLTKLEVKEESKEELEEVKEIDGE